MKESFAGAFARGINLGAVHLAADVDIFVLNWVSV